MWVFPTSWFRFGHCLPRSRCPLLPQAMQQYKVFEEEAELEESEDEEEKGFQLEASEKESESSGEEPDHGEEVCLGCITMKMAS